jgi:His Kinase A (phospho-acceptor) domain
MPLPYARSIDQCSLSGSGRRHPTRRVVPARRSVVWRSVGLSEALQEEVYGPLNDRQRRSLHSIEESGRHLLELINDILDLAKIGAGKLELALEPASIATICQASLRLSTQLAHQKRLSVDLTIDPTVTMLNVDARRLKQILVNLLSNAVKFTPVGGSIGPGGGWQCRAPSSRPDRVGYRHWDRRGADDLAVSALRPAR